MQRMVVGNNNEIKSAKQWPFINTCQGNYRASSYKKKKGKGVGGYLPVDQL